MRRLFIAVCLFALVSGAAHSGDWNEPWAVSLSTNPLKLGMGLVNLEADLRVLPLASIDLFAEYLVFDYAISRAEHPDLVLRAGMRFRPFGNPLPGLDPVVGPYLCWTWEMENIEVAGFGFGLELGLRFRFLRDIFVFPKAMVMYAHPAGTIVPGFEACFGLTL